MASLTHQRGSPNGDRQAMPNLSPEKLGLNLTPQQFSKLPLHEKYLLLLRANRAKVTKNCAWWTSLDEHDRSQLVDHNDAVKRRRLSCSERSNNSTGSKLKPEKLVFVREFRALFDVFSNGSPRSIDFQLDVQRQSCRWIRAAVQRIADSKTQGKAWDHAFRVGSSSAKTTKRKAESADHANQRNIVLTVEDVKCVFPEEVALYTYITKHEHLLPSAENNVNADTVSATIVRQSGNSSESTLMAQKGPARTAEQNAATVIGMPPPNAFARRLKILRYLDSSTQQMSLAEYLRFERARERASFTRRGRKSNEAKFMRWISEQPSLGQRPTVDFSSAALKIMDFLLCDRVAHILQTRNSNEKQ